MIDWLTVNLPLLHNPLPQGRRLTLNAEGEVLTDFVMPHMIEEEEGSYSKRLLVSSTDCAYTQSHFNLVPAGMVTCLTISGNPVKFLQGHNCFGVECIRSILIATIDKIKGSLGLSRKQHKRLIDAINADEYQVTRIDITRMFDLGSNSAVNQYIRMLQFVADTRGNRCEMCKNTFYVGKHSGLWSIKFYNKYAEITSKSKQHALPLNLRDSGIAEWVKGQLRIELVLRKQQLDRLNIQKPSELQNQLDEIYSNFLGRIVMKNQQQEFDYKKLRKAVQHTYLLWKDNHDVKAVLRDSDKSDSTFYRHAKILREYGINIKKPPIPENERLAIIKPLPLLIPKVAEVPPHLLKYQIQKVA